MNFTSSGILDYFQCDLTFWNNFCCIVHYCTLFQPRIYILCTSVSLFQSVCFFFLFSGKHCQPMCLSVNHVEWAWLSRLHSPGNINQLRHVCMLGSQPACCDPKGVSLGSWKTGLSDLNLKACKTEALQRLAPILGKWGQSWQKENSVDFA